MMTQARTIRRQSEFRTEAPTCFQSSLRPNHQIRTRASRTSAPNSRYLRYFPNYVDFQRVQKTYCTEQWRKMARANKNHKILRGAAKATIVCRWSQEATDRRFQ